MSHQTMRHLALLLLSPLLLACLWGGSGRMQPSAQTDTIPVWACPSPTPMRYGEAGPIKGYAPVPTLEPGGPIDEQPVYYEAWEQEYGTIHPGPPFPSPTPYAITGTSFSFGQRVRIGQIYATVQARPGAPQPSGQHLALVDVIWNNPASEQVAIQYGSQVAVRSVMRAGGQIVTGDGWFPSTEALRQAGGTELPLTIPPGESRVTVPILTPAGAPHTVELLVLRDVAASYPGPNTDLRQQRDQRLTVQWTATTTRIGPPCPDPGAMTDLPPEVMHGPAWGNGAVPAAAPPGATRVVQIAMQQVGKPYVWAATGPNSFDCSGLMQWSYAQIGMRILRTAQQQHNSTRHIRAAELQPGDLIFFSDINRATSVTHVAMYIGDVDGDGKGDVVHAMSPTYGIRVTPAIFHHTFYTGRGCKLCIVGFGTYR